MHDPNLRASDADRERVADQLRQHCGEGRLTMEEFHTRLDACFEAKTLGDLDALIADLPGPSPYDDLPVPATQRAGHSVALPDSPRPAPWHPALRAYLTVNLVCWMIWAIGGASMPPWPVWVSGPWGAILLARAVTGGGPGGRSGGPPARRDDR